MAFPHCTVVIKIHNILLDEVVTGSTTQCSYCGKAEIHNTLLDELVTVSATVLLLWET